MSNRNTKPTAPVKKKRGQNRADESFNSSSTNNLNPNLIGNNSINDVDASRQPSILQFFPKQQSRDHHDKHDVIEGIVLNKQVQNNNGTNPNQTVQNDQNLPVKNSNVISPPYDLTTPSCIPLSSSFFKNVPNQTDLSTQTHESPLFSANIDDNLEPMRGSRHNSQSGAYTNQNNHQNNHNQFRNHQMNQLPHSNHNPTSSYPTTIVTKQFNDIVIGRSTAIQSLTGKIPLPPLNMSNTTNTHTTSTITPRINGPFNRNSNNSNNNTINGHGQFNDNDDNHHHNHNNQNFTANSNQTVATNQNHPSTHTKPLNNSLNNSIHTNVNPNTNNNFVHNHNNYTQNSLSFNLDYSQLDPPNNSTPQDHNRVSSNQNTLAPQYNNQIQNPHNGQTNDYNNNNTHNLPFHSNTCSNNNSVNHTQYRYNKTHKPTMRFGMIETNPIKPGAVAADDDDDDDDGFSLKRMETRLFVHNHPNGDATQVDEKTQQRQAKQKAARGDGLNGGSAISMEETRLEALEEQKQRDLDYKRAILTGNRNNFTKNTTPFDYCHDDDNGDDYSNDRLRTNVKKQRLSIEDDFRDILSKNHTSNNNNNIVQLTSGMDDMDDLPLHTTRKVPQSLRKKPRGNQFSNDNNNNNNNNNTRNKRPLTFSDDDPLNSMTMGTDIYPGNNPNHLKNNRITNNTHTKAISKPSPQDMYKNKSNNNFRTITNLSATQTINLSAKPTLHISTLTSPVHQIDQVNAKNDKGVTETHENDEYPSFLTKLFNGGLTSKLNGNPQFYQNQSRFGQTNPTTPSSGVQSLPSFGAGMMARPGLGATKSFLGAIGQEPLSKFINSSNDTTPHTNPTNSDNQTNTFVNPQTGGISGQIPTHLLTHYPQTFFQASLQAELGYFDRLQHVVDFAHQQSFFDFGKGMNTNHISEPLHTNLWVHKDDLPINLIKNIDLVIEILKNQYNISFDNHHNRPNTTTTMKNSNNHSQQFNSQHQQTSNSTPNSILHRPHTIMPLPAPYTAPIPDAYNIKVPFNQHVDTTWNNAILLFLSLYTQHTSNLFLTTTPIAYNPDTQSNNSNTNLQDGSKYTTQIQQYNQAGQNSRANTNLNHNSNFNYNAPLSYDPNGPQSQVLADQNHVQYGNNHNNNGRNKTRFDFAPPNSISTPSLGPSHMPPSNLYSQLNLSHSNQMNNENDSSNNQLKQLTSLPFNTHVSLTDFSHPHTGLQFNVFQAHYYMVLEVCSRVFSGLLGNFFLSLQNNVHNHQNQPLLPKTTNLVYSEIKNRFRNQYNNTAVSSILNMTTQQTHFTAQKAQYFNLDGTISYTNPLELIYPDHSIPNTVKMSLYYTNIDVYFSLIKVLSPILFQSNAKPTNSASNLSENMPNIHSYVEDLKNEKFDFTPFLSIFSNLDDIINLPSSISNYYLNPTVSFTMNDHKIPCFEAKFGGQVVEMTSILVNFWLELQFFIQALHFHYHELRHEYLHQLQSYRDRSNPFNSGITNQSQSNTNNGNLVETTLIASTSTDITTTTTVLTPSKAPCQPKKPSSTITKASKNLLGAKRQLHAKGSMSDLDDETVLLPKSGINALSSINSIRSPIKPSNNNKKLQPPLSLNHSHVSWTQSADQPITNAQHSSKLFVSPANHTNPSGVISSPSLVSPFTMKIPFDLDENQIITYDNNTDSASSLRFVSDYSSEFTSSSDSGDNSDADNTYDNTPVVTGLPSRNQNQTKSNSNNEPQFDYPPSHLLISLHYLIKQLVAIVHVYEQFISTDTGTENTLIKTEFDEDGINYASVTKHNFLSDGDSGADESSLRNRSNKKEFSRNFEKTQPKISPKNLLHKDDLLNHKELNLLMHDKLTNYDISTPSTAPFAEFLYIISTTHPSPQYDPNDQFSIDLIPTHSKAQFLAPNYANGQTYNSNSTTPYSDFGYKPFTTPSSADNDNPSINIIINKQNNVESINLNQSVDNNQPDIVLYNYAIRIYPNNVVSATPLQCFPLTLTPMAPINSTLMKNTSQKSQKSPLTADSKNKRNTFNDDNDNDNDDRNISTVDLLGGITEFRTLDKNQSNELINTTTPQNHHQITQLNPLGQNLIHSTLKPSQLATFKAWKKQLLGLAPYHGENGKKDNKISHKLQKIFTHQQKKSIQSRNGDTAVGSSSVHKIYNTVSGNILFNNARKCILQYEMMYQDKLNSLFDGDVRADTYMNDDNDDTTNQKGHQTHSDSKNNVTSNQHSNDPPHSTLLRNVATPATSLSTLHNDLLLALYFSHRQLSLIPWPVYHHYETNQLGQTYRLSQSENESPWTQSQDLKLQNLQNFKRSMQQQKGNGTKMTTGLLYPALDTHSSFGLQSFGADWTSFNQNVLNQHGNKDNTKSGIILSRLPLQGSSPHKKTGRFHNYTPELIIDIAQHHDYNAANNFSDAMAQNDSLLLTHIFPLMIYHQLWPKSPLHNDYPIVQKFAQTLDSFMLRYRPVSGQILGQGNFGTVSLYYDTVTRQRYVLKEVQCTGASYAKPHTTENEFSKHKVKSSLHEPSNNPKRKNNLGTKDVHFSPMRLLYREFYLPMYIHRIFSHKISQLYQSNLNTALRFGGINNDSIKQFIPFSINALSPHNESITKNNIILSSFSSPSFHINSTSLPSPLSYMSKWTDHILKAITNYLHLDTGKYAMLYEYCQHGTVTKSFLSSSTYECPRSDNKTPTHVDAWIDLMAVIDPKKDISPQLSRITALDHNQAMTLLLTRDIITKGYNDVIMGNGLVTGPAFNSNISHYNNQYCNDSDHNDFNLTNKNQLNPQSHFYQHTSVIPIPQPICTVTSNQYHSNLPTHSTISNFEIPSPNLTVPNTGQFELNTSDPTLTTTTIGSFSFNASGNSRTNPAIITNNNNHNNNNDDNNMHGTHLINSKLGSGNLGNENFTQAITQKTNPNDLFRTSLVPQEKILNSYSQWYLAQQNAYHAQDKDTYQKPLCMVPYYENPSEMDSGNQNISQQTNNNPTTMLDEQDYQHLTPETSEYPVYYYDYPHPSEVPLKPSSFCAFTTLSILQQLTQGLAAMHLSDVVHLDIKLDNLLISNTPQFDQFQEENMSVLDFSIENHINLSHPLKRPFITRPQHLNTMLVKPGIVFDLERALYESIYGLVNAKAIGEVLQEGEQSEYDDSDLSSDEFNSSDYGDDHDDDDYNIHGNNDAKNYDLYDQHHSALYSNRSVSHHNNNSSDDFDTHNLDDIRPLDVPNRLSLIDEEPPIGSRGQDDDDDDYDIGLEFSSAKKKQRVKKELLDKTTNDTGSLSFYLDVSDNNGEETFINSLDQLDETVKSSSSFSLRTNAQRQPLTGITYDHITARVQQDYGFNDTKDNDDDGFDLNEDDRLGTPTRRHKKKIQHNQINTIGPSIPNQEGRSNRGTSAGDCEEDSNNNNNNNNTHSHSNNDDSLENTNALQTRATKKGKSVTFTPSKPKSGKLNLFGTPQKTPKNHIDSDLQGLDQEKTTNHSNTHQELLSKTPSRSKKFNTQQITNGNNDIDDSDDLNTTQLFSPIQQERKNRTNNFTSTPTHKAVDSTPRHKDNTIRGNSNDDYTNLQAAATQILPPYSQRTFTQCSDDSIHNQDSYQLGDFASVGSINATRDDKNNSHNTKPHHDSNNINKPTNSSSFASTIQTQVVSLVETQSIEKVSDNNTQLLSPVQQHPRKINPKNKADVRSNSGDYCHHHGDFTAKPNDKTDNHKISPLSFENDQDDEKSQKENQNDKIVLPKSSTMTNKSSSTATFNTTSITSKTTHDIDEAPNKAKPNPNTTTDDDGQVIFVPLPTLSIETPNQSISAYTPNQNNTNQTLMSQNDHFGRLNHRSTTRSGTLHAQKAFKCDQNSEYGKNSWAGSQNQNCNTINMNVTASAPSSTKLTTNVSFAQQLSQGHHSQAKSKSNKGSITPASSIISSQPTTRSTRRQSAKGIDDTSLPLFSLHNTYVPSPYAQPFEHSAVSCKKQDGIGTNPIRKLSKLDHNSTFFTNLSSSIDLTYITQLYEQQGYNVDINSSNTIFPPLKLDHIFTSLFDTQINFFNSNNNNFVPKKLPTIFSHQLFSRFSQQLNTTKIVNELLLNQIDHISDPDQILFPLSTPLPYNSVEIDELENSPIKPTKSSAQSRTSQFTPNLIDFSQLMQQQTALSFKFGDFGHAMMYDGRNTLTARVKSAYNILYYELINLYNTTVLQIDHIQLSLYDISNQFNLFVKNNDTSHSTASPSISDLDFCFDELLAQTKLLVYLYNILTIQMNHFETVKNPYHSLLQFNSSKMSQTIGQIGDLYSFSVDSRNTCQNSQDKSYDSNTENNSNDINVANHHSPNPNNVKSMSLSTLFTIHMPPGLVNGNITDDAKTLWGSFDSVHEQVYTSQHGILRDTYISFIRPYFSWIRKQYKTILEEVCLIVDLIVSPKQNVKRFENSQDATMTTKSTTLGTTIIPPKTATTLKNYLIQLLHPHIVTPLQRYTITFPITKLLPVPTPLKTPFSHFSTLFLNPKDTSEGDKVFLCPKLLQNGSLSSQRVSYYGGLHSIHHSASPIRYTTYPTTMNSIPFEPTYRTNTNKHKKRPLYMNGSPTNDLLSVLNHFKLYSPSTTTATRLNDMNRWGSQIEKTTIRPKNTTHSTQSPLFSLGELDNDGGDGGDDGDDGDDIERHYDVQYETVEILPLLLKEINSMKSTLNHAIVPMYHAPERLNVGFILIKPEHNIHNKNNFYYNNPTESHNHDNDNNNIQNSNTSNNNSHPNLISIPDFALFRRPDPQQYYSTNNPHSPIDNFFTSNSYQRLRQTNLETISGIFSSGQPQSPQLISSSIPPEKSPLINFANPLAIQALFPPILTLDSCDVYSLGLAALSLYTQTALPLQSEPYFALRRNNQYRWSYADIPRQLTRTDEFLSNPALVYDGSQLRHNKHSTKSINRYNLDYFSSEFIPNLPSIQQSSQEVHNDGHSHNVLFPSIISTSTLPIIFPQSNLPAYMTHNNPSQSSFGTHRIPFTTFSYNVSIPQYLDPNNGLDILSANTNSSCATSPTRIPLSSVVVGGGLKGINETGYRSSSPNSNSKSNIQGSQTLTALPNTYSLLSFPFFASWSQEFDRFISMVKNDQNNDMKHDEQNHQQMDLKSDNNDDNFVLDENNSIVLLPIETKIVLSTMLTNIRHTAATPTPQLLVHLANIDAIPSTNINQNATEMVNTLTHSFFTEALSHYTHTSHLIRYQSSGEISINHPLTAHLDSFSSSVGRDMQCSCGGFISQNNKPTLQFIKDLILTHHNLLHQAPTTTNGLGQFEDNDGDDNEDGTIVDHHVITVNFDTVNNNKHNNNNLLKHQHGQDNFTQTGDIAIPAVLDPAAIDGNESMDFRSYDNVDYNSSSNADNFAPVNPLPSLITQQPFLQLTQTQIKMTAPAVSSTTTVQSNLHSLTANTSLGPLLNLPRPIMAVTSQYSTNPLDTVLAPIRISHHIPFYRTGVNYIPTSTTVESLLSQLNDQYQPHTGQNQLNEQPNQHSDQASITSYNRRPSRPNQPTILRLKLPDDITLPVPTPHLASYPCLLGSITRSMCNSQMSKLNKNVTKNSYSFDLSQNLASVQFEGLYKPIYLQSILKKIPFFSHTINYSNNIDLPGMSQLYTYVHQLFFGTESTFHCQKNAPSGDSVDNHSNNNSNNNASVPSGERTQVCPNNDNTRKPTQLNKSTLPPTIVSSTQNHPTPQPLSNIELGLCSHVVSQTVNAYLTPYLHYIIQSMSHASSLYTQGDEIPFHDVQENAKYKQFDNALDSDQKCSKKDLFASKNNSPARVINNDFINNTAHVSKNTSKIIKSNNISSTNCLNGSTNEMKYQYGTNINIKAPIRHIPMNWFNHNDKSPLKKQTQQYQTKISQTTFIEARPDAYQLAQSLNQALPQTLQYVHVILQYIQWCIAMKKIVLVQMNDIVSCDGDDIKQSYQKQWELQQEFMGNRRKLNQSKKNKLNDEKNISNDREKCPRVESTSNNNYNNNTNRILVPLPNDPLLIPYTNIKYINGIGRQYQYELEYKNILIESGENNHSTNNDNDNNTNNNNHQPFEFSFTKLQKTPPAAVTRSDSTTIIQTSIRDVIDQFAKHDCKDIKEIVPILTPHNVIIEGGVENINSHWGDNGLGNNSNIHYENNHSNNEHSNNNNNNNHSHNNRNNNKYFDSVPQTNHTTDNLPNTSSSQHGLVMSTQSSSQSHQFTTTTTTSNNNTLNSTRFSITNTQNGSTSSNKLSQHTTIMIRATSTSSQQQQPTISSSSGNHQHNDNTRPMTPSLSPYGIASHYTQNHQTPIKLPPPHSLSVLSPSQKPSIATTIQSQIDEHNQVLQLPLELWEPLQFSEIRAQKFRFYENNFGLNDNFDHQNSKLLSARLISLPFTFNPMSYRKEQTNNHKHSNNDGSNRTHTPMSFSSQNCPNNNISFGNTTYSYSTNSTNTNSNHNNNNNSNSYINSNNNNVNLNKNNENYTKFDNSINQYYNKTKNSTQIMIMNPLDVFTHVISSLHYRITIKNNDKSEIMSQNEQDDIDQIQPNNIKLSNLNKSQCKLLSHLPHSSVFSNLPLLHSSSPPLLSNVNNNQFDPIRMINPLGFALFHNVLNYLAMSATALHDEFDMIMNDLYTLCIDSTRGCYEGADSTDNINYNKTKTSPNMNNNDSFETNFNQNLEKMNQNIAIKLAKLALRKQHNCFVWVEPYYA